MPFYAGICQENEQQKMPENTCYALNINPFERFLTMLKILFVCHGNICRSPMAEFVMKDLARKAGQESRFHIESAATSTEEIGNPVCPPARRKLTCADYARYDLLIGMDRANLRNMNRICNGDPEGKIQALLAYAGRAGEEVADPWYTGDFETAYRDILAGCRGLLESAARKEGV